MNDEELKTKIFEALGEASMQWNPRPSGVFDSTGCKTVGDKLWDIIKANLDAGRESGLREQLAAVRSWFKHELVRMKLSNELGGLREASIRDVITMIEVEK